MPIHKLASEFEDHPEEDEHCEDAPMGQMGMHSDHWYDGQECIWCGRKISDE